MFFKIQVLPGGTSGVYRSITKGEYRKSLEGHPTLASATFERRVQTEKLAPPVQHGRREQKPGPCADDWIRPEIGHLWSASGYSGKFGILSWFEQLDHQFRSRKNLLH